MNHELYGRACRAYLRGGQRVPIPSWYGSDVDEHENVTATITLRNVNGVLARYRHYPRTDRLRRLPCRREA
jgi:hypothetical protein